MVGTAPLIWFFVLSYAIAWTIWIAIGIMLPDLDPDRGTFITVPGAWAPTIAALVVTARYEGREGLRDLLTQVCRWRIGWRWYGLAVLGPTALGLLAVGLHVLLGGTPPSLAAVAAGFDLPAEEAVGAIVAFPMVFLLLCLGGPMAEESGWRGFAQARLQRRFGAGPAGLVIGFIWALWHLPLIVFVPSGTGEIPTWFYLPMVAALGVVFAWGYNRTGQSVLFTILLHAGVNTCLAYRIVTVPESPVLLAITLALLLGVAAAAYRQMGSARGSGI